MASKYRLLAILAILPVMSIVGVIAWEMQGVILLPKPTDIRSISVSEISYEAWNELLGRFVDDQGRVAYREWKGSTDSQAMLDKYLSQAGQVKISADSPKLDVLAYWINLYNALTIKGILQEYPTKSILDHVRPIGYHIWKDLKVYADGAYRSLDDIEHEILRKMGEPRIHFAIVCASAGCPRLRNEAYVPDRLEVQLSDNARHFFAQESNFKVSDDGKVIELSSLLKWFGKDFGNSDAKMLAGIAPYLPAEGVKAIESAPSPRIIFLAYDWRLNERPRNPSP
jgi:hypothetical protein